MKIVPVILSGGSGTRLWPLSRKLRAKQYLPIIGGEESLFQRTLMRLAGMRGLDAPIIVCSESDRFIVADQLLEITQAHNGIILEPEGKNTAPAIALAALALEDKPDVLMLVLPADHVIANNSKFLATIQKGIEYAKQKRLVTFGIVPSSPETGYGYIRHDGNNNVLDFVEKPNLKTAEEYFDSGEYWWNSGMFLLSPSAYLNALAKYGPDILGCCREAMDVISKDGDFIRPNKESFSLCRNISIDYAVMEKSNNCAVVPLDAGWNDVGTWSSVWQISEKDQSGNVIYGDAVVEGASNNLIHSNERLVTLLGVDDLVVVDTKDAVLVAKRDQAQHVKKIVEELHNLNRSEIISHREIFRPWGSYDLIDQAPRYQVKRITVNPGEKLSLQMHYHRAEHWIVVSGTAEVNRGEETFLLTENQSTYIPLGKKHSLANPGKVPLEIIEIQSGSYLEEDDIVRFEDRYGRAMKSEKIG